MKRKIVFTGLALAILSVEPTFAGGLLTNTNASIAFNRNFARDGVIAIDGVYSNPAGVAFLPQGFHLNLNVQNIYQTRTINSGVSVAGLEKTPFYQPFKLNGGDATTGVKTFEGKASVPVLPSFQAALNYDKWGFQLGFTLVGGGGKATFNQGLASFERQVSLVPLLLQQSGIAATTPGYSVESYIQGQQYIFGTQLGATYKVNEHLALYAGARFNYIYNKYVGSITNISANIADQKNVNLYNYLGEMQSKLDAQAAAYAAQAAATTDPTLKAQLTAGAQMAAAGSQKAGQTKDLVKDRHLDCSQTGWGITPIIGLDYRIGKLNIGTRFEFTNRLNIQNNTKVDDTGLFADGVNTPADIPGLFTLGAQYEVLPTLRVMGSWHYYLDKDAKMANDKQKLLASNTQEYLAGVEWDITKDLMISAGGQSTRYGLGDGGYLTDMSFVTSSYSLGFGARFKIAKNAAVNVAYFWTNYETFDKSSTQTVALGANKLTLNNTDSFTRTNRVLGAGVEIDF